MSHDKQQQKHLDKIHTHTNTHTFFWTMGMVPAGQVVSGKLLTHVSRDGGDGGRGDRSEGAGLSQLITLSDVIG